MTRDPSGLGQLISASFAGCKVVSALWVSCLLIETVKPQKLRLRQAVASRGRRRSLGWFSSEVAPASRNQGMERIGVAMYAPWRRIAGVAPHHELPLPRTDQPVLDHYPECVRDPPAIHAAAIKVMDKYRRYIARTPSSIAFFDGYGTEEITHRGSGRANKVSQLSTPSTLKTNWLFSYN